MVYSLVSECGSPPPPPPINVLFCVLHLSRCAIVDILEEIAKLNVHRLRLLSLSTSLYGQVALQIRTLQLRLFGQFLAMPGGLLNVSGPLVYNAEEIVALLPNALFQLMHSVQHPP